MNNLFTSLKPIQQQIFVNKLFKSIRLIGLEGLIWISALIYLALFNDPFHQHFTICPLANAGIEYCPGCGLGNSISLLFNGHFSESFETHFLAIPAIIIIVYRIYSIIKFNRNKIYLTK